MGPRGEDLNIAIIYLTISFIVLAAFIIIFIRFYRLKLNNHIYEKEKLQAQYQQEILRTQLEIQEQTFKNIGEEIHDNVGQILSLAKLNLNTLTTNEAQKIADTKDLVGKAITDLRNLSRSMHGDRIAQLGLQDSLAVELKLIENTGQFTTGMAITGEPYKLSSQIETVLFRISQEAFNNAVKYSKAQHITVEIHYGTAMFALLLADDGIGFNTETTEAANPGIGLINMKNRAALIGGEFVLHSSFNKGTAITVKLPKNTNPPKK